MRGQILLGVLCISAAACDPEDKVVDGKTPCETVGRCGDGWVCEERKDIQPGKFCYRPRADEGDTGGDNTGGGNEPANSGGTTGGDNNMTTMSAPPSFSGFSTVGGRRTDSSGKFAIYDDGFEGGPRLCSNDSQFCVTGGFTP